MKKTKTALFILILIYCFCWGIQKEDYKGYQFFMKSQGNGELIRSVPPCENCYNYQFNHMGIDSVKSAFKPTLFPRFRGVDLVVDTFYISYEMGLEKDKIDINKYQNWVNLILNRYAIGRNVIFKKGNDFQNKKDINSTHFKMNKFWLRYFLKSKEIIEHHRENKIIVSDSFYTENSPARSYGNIRLKQTILSHSKVIKSVSLFIHEYLHNCSNIPFGHLSDDYDYVMKKNMYPCQPFIRSKDIVRYSQNSFLPFSSYIKWPITQDYPCLSKFSKDFEDVHPLNLIHGEEFRIEIEKYESENLIKDKIKGYYLGNLYDRVEFIRLAKKEADFFGIERDDIEEYARLKLEAYESIINRNIKLFSNYFYNNDTTIMIHDIDVDSALIPKVPVVFIPEVEVHANIDSPPPQPVEDEMFKVVEQMPRFPGCEDMSGSEKEKEDCAKQKMLEYIYKNLKYPVIARENGVEGMCVIQFVVDKDGSVTETNVVRDIGAGCGTAALKVVDAMNSLPQKWTPGKQRGQNVKVIYALPVRFKLEG